MHTSPYLNQCLKQVGKGVACLLFLMSSVSLQAEVFGYTEPFQEIEVSAAESGVLQEILVEEGQMVKKDQILAKLGTRVLEQDLRIAQESLNFKKRRFEKMEKLHAAGRAHPEEYARALSDVAIEEAKVKRTEALIERHLLRSPVDGIVTEIKRDAAESISAANPHVMTVVQIDRLRANLFLPKKEARQLKEGTNVQLLFQDLDQAVPALVEFVSPIADAASGTVRVKFLINNSDGKVKSGERCELAATSSLH